MKIAVCIKQVPDTETKIKLNADRSGVDPSGTKWIVNPYDEHAIEEGIKLRDAQPGSQLFVYSCGPKTRTVDAVRTALAMGADEGIVIDGPESLDSFTVALALSKALEKDGPFDLILTGKLAIDDNASSVTQMLAEKLKIPHTNVVSKLTSSAASVTVERESDGGTRETVEMSLPAVVGANKGLNTPRYASLPGIMKAKKKTIRELSLKDLGVDSAAAYVFYSDYQLPPDKPSVKMLTGTPAEQAKKLVGLLRDEAKVL